MATTREWRRHIIFLERSCSFRKRLARVGNALFFRIIPFPCPSCIHVFLCYRVHALLDIGRGIATRQNNKFNIYSKRESVLVAEGLELIRSSIIQRSKQDCPQCMRCGLYNASFFCWQSNCTCPYSDSHREGVTLHPRFECNNVDLVDINKQLSQSTIRRDSLMQEVVRWQLSPDAITNTQFVLGLP